MTELQPELLGRSASAWCVKELDMGNITMRSQAFLISWLKNLCWETLGNSRQLVIPDSYLIMQVLCLDCLRNLYIS